MYLYWAVLTRIKECGRLDGAFGSVMPSFPKSGTIPRALFAFLKYLGVYNYNGAKYSVTMTMSAAPSGVSYEISGSGTGISYGLVYPVGKTTYSATYAEWYTDYADATAVTFAQVTTAYDAYAEYFESLGVGVAYGELDPEAPDGSFYSYIYAGNFGQVYNTVPYFNPVVGYICATTISTGGFFPLFRQAIPDAYSDYITAGYQLYMGFVFITNRMDVKSLKRRNGWNYFGEIGKPCCNLETS